MVLVKRRSVLKKSMRSFAEFAQPKKGEQLTKTFGGDMEADQVVAKKSIGTARPGKVALPTITFRVTQEQWERLKMLAIQDRTTLQNLAEQAFAEEFKRR